MKQVIYFNNPQRPNKLSFIVTDKTVDYLKSQGIINNTATTLIKKFCDDEQSIEYAKQVHVDKLVFNNQDNPTDVVFDNELVQMYYIDIFRQIRKDSLDILDRLQMRAASQNYNDLVKDIETDKQLLRDIPTSLNYNKTMSIIDISQILPQSLLVNYEEKYSYQFERRNRLDNK